MMVFWESLLHSMPSSQHTRPSQAAYPTTFAAPLRSAGDHIAVLPSNAHLMPAIEQLAKRLGIPSLDDVFTLEVCNAALVLLRQCGDSSTADMFELRFTDP